MNLPLPALRIVLPALTFICLIACLRPRSQERFSVPPPIPVQALSSGEFPEASTALQVQYDSLLTAIEQVRKRFSAQAETAPRPASQNAIHSEARQFLQNTLTKNIWPAWLGTPWDFNGISEQPGEGKIACGYFVSTTLKHAGFRLNRYRLAQQGATEICKALSPELHRFQGLDAMQAYLEAREGDHLYVLGLDYHVGFIEQQDSSLHFTHASYYAPAEVVSQSFSESAVLQASNSYVLAPLFESGTLVEDWLKGRKVYPKP